MAKSGDNAHPYRPRPRNELKGAAKTVRIPIEVEPKPAPLRKPPWIRARSPNLPAVIQLKAMLEQHGLHTVCQEAACPNIGECFSHRTATFMVMGNLCTRRCPFCDVAHGRPAPPDPDEPENLARVVAAMELQYVVVTSVDRDDLRDGGAFHFVACIRAIRRNVPEIRIEILVPDFRGRMEAALDIFGQAVPDVFNHNLETVPRLYKRTRPGADYGGSLNLLQEFKRRYPEVPTKSGLMVGLGETNAEIETAIADLHARGCDMLTIGQYLQPSGRHLPVMRYVTPAEFEQFSEHAKAMGFRHVASSPMVRSSYHADRHATEAGMI